MKLVELKIDAGVKVGVCDGCVICYEDSIYILLPQRMRGRPTDTRNMKPTIFETVATYFNLLQHM